MYKETAGNMAGACAFLRAAVSAVENASVNILQLNAQGITSSKLNINEQLVLKHAVQLILLQKSTAPMQLKLYSQTMI